MNKNYIYHAIIAAGVVCTGFLFWHLLAPSGDQRISTAELRSMLRDGETPEIRALGASGLGARRDMPCVPLLLAAMEDEAPLVRGHAAQAVAQILGADAGFDAQSSEEERQIVIGKYTVLWEAWREKTGYNEELVLPRGKP